MDCSNCAAPLPAKSNLCAFCGTLNDTDLRAIEVRGDVGPTTERVCPRCNEQLHSITLNVGTPLVVERCTKCLGIFFDPGELETLIEAGVSHVMHIDFNRMATLSEEEGPADIPLVTYVKCPQCQKTMNREAYGARSGVIVDVCRADGVWLDGSELGRILKWVKAGGQIYADKRLHERKRSEERKKKNLAKQAKMESTSGGLYVGDVHRPSGDLLWDILSAVARLIR